MFGFFLRLCHLVVVACGHTSIRVAILFGPLGTKLDESQLKPAIDIALEHLHMQVVQGELLNFTYVTYLRETVWNGQRIGVGLVADLVSEHDIHVVFGHPNSFEMYGIGDLVAYWNIPAITSAATSSDLEDRRRFKTFTRVSLSARGTGKFVESIFHLYGWKRCGVIYTNRGVFSLFSDAVFGVLDEANIIYLPISTDDMSNATQLLRDSQAVARSKPKFPFQIAFAKDYGMDFWCVCRFWSR
ncbi:Receptor-type guanylate cyclase gcy-8 [Holothuria leucospilota]|uniref:Receptor-type guanylate cyclase gcy-8 n=1 Tax=Holothuria leucospilota TaxID=206669 RepID=A0A9Q1H8B0_HOLLE|nr:Receptor-type guanylate cyclase gcy-8 [Holothuria leucospilota]